MAITPLNPHPPQLATTPKPDAAPLPARPAAIEDTAPPASEIAPHARFAAQVRTLAGGAETLQTAVSLLQTADLALANSVQVSGTVNIEGLTESRFNGHPLFGHTHALPGAPPIALPLPTTPAQVGALRQEIGGVLGHLRRNLAEFQVASQNLLSATTPGGDLLAGLAGFKSAQWQVRATLRATAAHLETADAVLDLLR